MKQQLHPLTVAQRAAVLSGHAAYSDPEGVPHREIDVTGWYYATNKGETFPQWVANRVADGELRVAMK